MQKIKGQFNVTFLGIPLAFVSKTELVAENGSVARIYSLHVTPFFAFGFVASKRRRKRK